MFDYDAHVLGIQQCFSPGGEYEILLYNVADHDLSVLHYQIGPKGERGFIYEWKPGGGGFRLWCMNAYFIVMIPDGSLHRGHYGEPIYPWYIGTPSSRWFYIGRAW